MLITDGFNLNDIIDISCNVELRIARLVRISILIIDESFALNKNTEVPSIFSALLFNTSNSTFTFLCGSSRRD